MVLQLSMKWDIFWGYYIHMIQDMEWKIPMVQIVL